MLWCIPCTFIHLFSISIFLFSLHFPHLSHLYLCHVTHVLRFGRDCCTNDIFDATLFKSAASKTSYLGQSLPNRKSCRVASSHCNATRSGPERHFSSTTTSPRTVHNTDIFSSSLMATLLTSPGAVDPSEHSRINGLST